VYGTDRVIELPRQVKRFSPGADGSGDVVIANEFLSAHHLILERRGSMLRVIDQDTKNHRRDDERRRTDVWIARSRQIDCDSLRDAKSLGSEALLRERVATLESELAAATQRADDLLLSAIDCRTRTASSSCKSSCSAGGCSWPRPTNRHAARARVHARQAQ